MKMNPVVHCEMPYEDKERMVNFYSQAFGWQAQMLGSDMGNYVVVTTTEGDEKTKRPKEPGAINGGFYKKPNDPHGQYPSLVIPVEAIHSPIKMVKKSAAKVIYAQN